MKDNDLVKPADQVIIRKTSRGGWFAFGCLTSVIIVIAGLLILTSMVAKLGSKTKIAVKPDSWLNLDLSGQIVEYTPYTDNFLSQGQPNVHSLVQKIDAAATDVNIRGILLEPTYLSMGRASMHELMLAIERFKKSGKKVYAYFNTCLNGDYLLATSADKIVLNPSASGGILLTGLGGRVTFYKNVLDKFGVKMHVVQAGVYKGAGETYSRTGFSPAYKKSVDAVLDEVYDGMLAMLANNRSLDKEAVRALYEERAMLFISGEEAIEAGLVDELSTRKQFLGSLDLDDKHLVSVDNYEPVQPVKTVSQKVAVLYAVGTIMPKANGFNTGFLNAKDMGKAIEQIEDDDNIKAMVLRVNSPGGSALESEIIWSLLQDVRSKKPIVVSMGDMAASGGYYISMAGEHVMVDPYTITGSIGVISMFPDASKGYKDFGFTNDYTTRGKFAQPFDLFTPWTEEKQKSIELFTATTYAEFKKRVADGRKLELDRVQELAQGRVWSSSAALENGLADEQGTLTDAINKAAELAHMDDYGTVYYPKPRNLIQTMIAERLGVDIKGLMMWALSDEELPLDKSLDEIRALLKDPVQMRAPITIE